MQIHTVSNLRHGLSLCELRNIFSDMHVKLFISLSKAKV